MTDSIMIEHFLVPDGVENSAQKRRSVRPLRHWIRSLHRRAWSRDEQDRGHRRPPSHLDSRHEGVTVRILTKSVEGYGLSRGVVCCSCRTRYLSDS